MRPDRHPSGMAALHLPRRATQRVELKRKTVESYRGIAGDDAVADLRDLASGLRGMRVLEVSSTATGGGVAELLATGVPLLRDLGIDAQWSVIPGDQEFFAFTKGLHNGLQGRPITIHEDERADYLRHNAEYARSLADGWDVVIVHDPQPAATRALVDHDGGARWVWRCHVDSSAPDPEAWEFVRPFVEHYDLAVFTLGEFVPKDLRIPVRLIRPAIDPLSSKNRELPGYLSRETVAELGVDVARPLMLQVSRFDPWKDPLGVVDVWRLVRRDFPSLQLGMVGAMAGDDPEAWGIYRELEDLVRGERDCFLLTNQMGVNAHEVNALQRVADVAIQKSIREGFGLVVSETLWKGTAMVAGRAGGIPAQLQDGVGGRLADGLEDFAGCVSHLLEHPSVAREMGVEGRRHIREQFLVTRLLRDELALLAELG